MCRFHHCTTKLLLHHKKYAAAQSTLKEQVIFSLLSAQAMPFLTSSVLSKLFSSESWMNKTLSLSFRVIQENLMCSRAPKKNA